MAESIEAPAKELLKQPNFASVGTIRKDGTAQVVIVWVDVDGEDVVLNTAEGRGWHNNLSRDPRVTVAVANKDNPYEFMSMTGTVVEDTREGANDHIDMLAKKYLGMDKYPMHKPGEERTKVRIKPDRSYYQAPPPS